MPNALKVAALSPSLKKPDADFKQFSNFRPISNLTLISKIIEKAVAEQLTDHVKTYHLDVMYQSAFKVLHSTETALLKVQNDILRAVDDTKSVILLLLDLSSTFDTVDHLILLSTLSHRFGIKGNTLAWSDSYLKDDSSPYCAVSEPNVYKHYKRLTRWNANRCYSLRITYLIFETFQTLFPTASLIFTAVRVFIK